MSKRQNNKQKAKKPRDWSVATLEPDEKRNLLGFFDLLLKVDRRVNPNLYKKNANN